jgi:hypothetical protein
VLFAHKLDRIDDGFARDKGGLEAHFKHLLLFRLVGWRATEKTQLAGIVAPAKLD